MSKKLKPNYQRSRGVALVTCLLILSLFTVMTLSMVIATTSDTLIDGYYRNARGSFYGADSGLNSARQYLVNQIYAAVPSTYLPSAGTPTLPTAATMLSNITNTSTGFGSYHSMLGGQTASWPGQFLINNTAASNPSSVTLVGCTPTPACNTPGTAIPSGTTALVYTYAYHLVAQGQSYSTETSVVEEYGNVVYTVEINPTTSQQTSFAAFGTLFDQYALCGGPFVPGTMSGKFFSNQSWNFGDANAVGTSTKYIFTGPVGLAQSQVGYVYGEYNQCDQVGASGANNGKSDTYKGITINPSFASLNFSQPAIPMPTNSYNQLSAVLDGLGDCPPLPATCSAPSQASMAVLTNAHGTSWPATGSTPSTGVYLPYTVTTSGGSTTKTLNSGAGGIYVQGSAAQMVLSTATVGSPAHTEQLIQVTQGSGGSAVTTTLTLDLTGNQTRMQDSAGNDTGFMAGLPTDLNTPVAEGCMVYVNGNISSNTSSSTPTGLSGPSSGPAIATGSGVTVVSNGVIDVTGSLTYTNEPVSLTTADTPVTPAPTNVLGIYTSGGNVELKPPSDVASMEIDASMAEISAGSSYGLIANWNNITTLNIVGGRVQNKALSGNSLTQRNIYFDQRFSSGFAPPWFPTTTVTTTATNTAVPDAPQVNRLSWVNSSAQ